MATVSAIPANLFAYSDQCTCGAQELQNWVRKVLSPTLLEYENGGGQCFTIDSDVATKVAAIYYTDREVRTVGQAFQRVGGQVAQPGAAQQVFVSTDSKVKSAMATLDAEQQHQGELKAGAALARKLSKDGDVHRFDEVSKALAAHADSPYFCAGFYNALTTAQIQQAMGSGSDVKALVSAYASGALTPGAEGNVEQALIWTQEGSTLPFMPGHDAIAASERADVMNALAANPAAATNFVHHLMSDGPALKAFLGGPGYWHTPPPGHALTPQIECQKAYLGLLKAAVPHMSPTDVHTLVTNMGDSFPKEVSAGDLSAILPELKEFMKAGGKAMAEPLPSQAYLREHPTALEDWASRFGQRMQSFDGLYKSIAQVYETDGANNDKIREVVVDSMFAAGFAFPPRNGRPSGSAPAARCSATRSTWARTSSAISPRTASRTVWAGSSPSPVRWTVTPWRIPSST